MAIEGPLRELALSDVFQLLELSRKTGVLTIHVDGRDRPAMVRFDRGAVVGAELPDEQTRLGHLLLRSGKLSEAEMQRILREQRASPEIPFGTLAVRLGMATATEVKRQLAYQIEETVFELFRCKDGYFRFDEAPPHREGVLPVRIPTQSLLLEAARRTDEWATLSEQIPHPGVVPVLEEEVDGSLSPLDLRPQEWEILAEIDGERTLKQIAIDLGRSDFEVAKTVFDLLSYRVVAVADGPAPVHMTRNGGAADASTDAGNALSSGRMMIEQQRWQEAVAALAVAVRLDPLDGDAHFYLGVAAARAGDFRRAEQSWRTFLRLPDGRGSRGELARRALYATTELRTSLEEASA